MPEKWKETIFIGVTRLAQKAITVAVFKQKSANLDASGRRDLAYSSLKWTAMIELLIIVAEFYQICRVWQEIEENEAFLEASQTEMQDIKTQIANHMTDINSKLEGLHLAASTANRDNLNPEYINIIISGIRLRLNPLREKVLEMSSAIGEFTIIYLATNMFFTTFIKEVLV